MTGEKTVSKRVIQKGVHVCLYRYVLRFVRASINVPTKYRSVVCYGVHGSGVWAKVGLPQESKCGSNNAAHQNIRRRYAKEECL